MTIRVQDAREIELANLGYQNNPFVVWNNLGAGATLGGTGIVTGGERENAVTGSTYDKWRSAIAGTVRNLSFDFGVATNISFAAIAAHNLATLGGQVALQRSDDGTTWVGAGTGDANPDDNGPVCFRLQQVGAVAYRHWRFSFTDIADMAELSVGVALMGNDLIIPRRLYQGYAPVITPTEVELQSNVSVGNELLGSSVIGRGSMLSATVANVPENFIRGGSWKSFQSHFNDGGGFFFAWRPRKYANDLHYCWRNGGTLRPSNTGPRDMMSIEMSAQVHNAKP